MQDRDYQKEFENRDTLGFLINRAGKVMANTLRGKLAEKGVELPFEQWTILFMLWQEDGRNQIELVQGLYKDKATITRGLHSLERLNFVVRITDEKDKRNKKIYLTHKGKKLKNEVIPLAHQTTEIAIQNISDREIKVCRKVLQKIFENLDKQ